MKELIVAIDGPSGAGKTTLSKLLAESLGYTHIDTGAMYRCVALAASRKGISADDSAGLQAICDRIQIDFERSASGIRVLMDEEDVSTAIRTPKNSLMASAVSANPVVRTALVELQRQMGQRGGVVLEGRDIGSVVFPHAEVKFYLTASDAERGRRRYDELRAKGQDVDLQQTTAEIVARDRADSTREHAPLVKADGAISIESDDLSIDEVLHTMVAHVTRARAQAGLPTVS